MRRLLFVSVLISAACTPPVVSSPPETVQNIAVEPDDPDGPGPDDSDDSEPLPASPTGLTPVAGDGSVSLTWNAVTGADAYKVSRAAAPGGPYAQLSVVQATTYTDAAVTNGQTYYYTVQAGREGVFSANAAEVAAQPSAVGGGGSTPPAAPTDLTLRVISDTSIRAVWSDNANNETGYTVERAASSEAFAGVASLAAAATTYTSAGLVSGTTYRFRVRAFNAQGNSAYSAESTAATAGGTPGNMVAISAGCFTMGDTFNEGISQDGPSHAVCLSNGYEIDTHEVTNAAYRACVTAGDCSAPANIGSGNLVHYYDVADFDAYPVVYVTWDQATAYCTWAGKRLPTEAEWEKAARGGLAGKRFPWGDTITCDNANYTTGGFDYEVDPQAGSPSCRGDTTIAGAYAPNAYGLYDMSGNVMEWVQDRWSNFAADGVTDPTGPAYGSERVTRGGDNSHDAEWAKVSARFPAYNDNGPYMASGTGFRCAR